MTPGILYVVATPIGNLEDITYRAVSVLKQVDVVAAEDTRHSKKLLHHFGIQKPMLSLHDFNERERSQQIVQSLEDGKSVALISDAGTPLISDPGYYLVSLVRQSGHKVVPVPGVSASIAALSVSGLPTDRFSFEGFLPAKSSARKKTLEAVSKEVRTLVFYESPHRVLDSVADMLAVLGGERKMVVARELTKTFETIKDGSISEIYEWMLADDNQQRGEFVLLLDGAAQGQDELVGSVDVDRLLYVLAAELPVKKVAKLVSELTGQKKNELYSRLLEMRQ